MTSTWNNAIPLPHWLGFTCSHFLQEGFHYFPGESANPSLKLPLTMLQASLYHCLFHSLLSRFLLDSILHKARNLVHCLLLSPSIMLGTQKYILNELMNGLMKAKTDNMVENFTFGIAYKLNEIKKKKSHQGFEKLDEMIKPEGVILLF